MPVPGAVLLWLCPGGLLTPQGRLVFNEINTIPGFTEHSRFPGMMKAAGLPFGELLSRMIEEAMEP